MRKSLGSNKGVRENSDTWGGGDVHYDLRLHGSRMMYGMQSGLDWLSPARHGR